MGDKCILLFLLTTISYLSAVNIVVILPAVKPFHTLPLFQLACDTDKTTASFTFFAPYDQKFQSCDHVQIIGVEAFVNPAHWSHLNMSVEDMRVYLLRPFWKREMMLGGLDVIAAAIMRADVVIADHTLDIGDFSFLHTLLGAVPNPPLITSIWDDKHIVGSNVSLVALLDAWSYGSFKRVLATDTERLSLGISVEASQYMSSVAQRKLSTQERERLREASEMHCTPKRMKELFGEQGMRVIDNIKVSPSDQSHFLSKYIQRQQGQCQDEDGLHCQEEFRLANAPSPRVLCMAFTYEPRHDSVRAAVYTWAAHCDGYLAVSNSTADESLPTVSLGTTSGASGEGQKLTESYLSMSIKSRLIWTSVAQSQLLDEYDFFLLSGDDVYVIVENLKDYLKYISYKAKRENRESSDPPIFIGRKMQQNKLLWFYHGGSGYVMNRAAVRILVDLFERRPAECLTNVHTSMEDVMTARCLLHGGISTFDVKDPVNGKHIFHPHTPAEAYHPTNEELRAQVASFQEGEECCSEHSVSFQDLLPVQMQCLHYKLYG